MTKKEVGILGTKYKVYLGVDPAKDKSLEKLYGLCDPKERVIKIVDMDALPSWQDSSKEAKRRQHRENLRHEILHAFFHESGLWGSSHSVNSWATDEEMTDWFSIQYPKIRKAYKELACDD